MPCWKYLEFYAYLVTHECPCVFIWVKWQIVPLHGVINIMNIMYSLPWIRILLRYSVKQNIMYDFVKKYLTWFLNITKDYNNVLVKGADMVSNKSWIDKSITLIYLFWWRLERLRICMLIYHICANYVHGKTLSIVGSKLFQVSKKIRLRITMHENASIL